MEKHEFKYDYNQETDTIVFTFSDRKVEDTVVDGNMETYYGWCDGVVGLKIKKFYKDFIANFKLDDLEINSWNELGDTEKFIRETQEEINILNDGHWNLDFDIFGPEELPAGIQLGRMKKENAANTAQDKDQ